MLPHYSREEFLALQNLHKNTNAIQKSAKDQSLVIADKADYLDKMENLLNDTRTFEKLNLKNDEILNTTVNQEKRAENIFKKLVASNSISEETRRSLKPVGTRSGIMYGLCKVHEDIIDNCLSFLPILSKINTLNKKLAKFLVPTLKSLTSYEYTVKDSFVFAEETIKQDSDFFMGNLDVVFLFTNICVDTLFENVEKAGLSKIQFKKLLSLATKETYFIFKEKLYK